VSVFGLLRPRAAMAGDPDHSGQEEDEVDDKPIGFEIWPAARAFLQWLISGGSDGFAAPDLRKTTLLELGAGTGFLATQLVADRRVGVKEVYATEGELDVLENMRRRIEREGLEDAIHAVHWDWEESSEVPATVPMEEVDLVIGTDLVYVGTAEENLADVVTSALRHARARQDLRALILLCDRPPGGEQFLPVPRADSGTRAVDRFLRACDTRALSVREVLLDETMEVPVLGELSLRWAKGGDEALRLFEVSSTRN